MSTSKIFIFLLVIAAGVFGALVYTGKVDLEGLSTGPSPAAQQLGSQIPDDSPYVYTDVMRDEPIPHKVMDALLAVYNNDLTNLLNGLRQEVAEGGDDDMQMAVSVLSEFENKLSVEGLASLGFKTDGYSALYGLGVLPAIQIELGDVAAFTALVERIDAKTGNKLQKKSGAGGEYWSLSEPGLPVELIVAAKEGFARIGLIPQGDADVLGMLMGEKPAATSILQGENYKQVLSKYGFTGQGGGYFDLSAILAAFTGKAQGINQQVADKLALSEQLPPLEPGCIALAEHLVAQMPRITSGFTELNTSKANVAAVWETSPAVSAHLQKMTGQVLAAPYSDDSLLSYALGIDMLGLKNALSAALTDIGKNAQGCSMVDPQQLAQANAMMGMSFAMLSPYKGVHVVVESLDVDFEGEKIRDIKAGLLITTEDPMSLLGMAGMLNPELAQLQLEVGGDAVALPIPAEAKEQLGEVYVQAVDKGLIIALGEGSLAGFANVAGQTPTDALGMMDIRFNMAKFVDLMKDAATFLENSGEMKPSDLEGMEDFVESMSTMGGIYERVGVNMRATENGLHTDQEMIFK